MIIGDELLLAKAAEQNNPQFLSSLVIKEYEADDQSTGVSFDQVLQALGDTFIFETGVNCPVDFCQVGKFRDGRIGYVEIIGPRDNLRKITALFPLFESETLSRKGHIKAVYTWLKLHMIDKKDKDEELSKKRQEDISQHYLDFFHKFKECGVATNEYVHGNLHVRSNTVNEKGIIEITITGETKAYPKMPLML